MWYLLYQVLGALLWLVAVNWHLKRNFKSKEVVLGLDLAFLILVSGLMGGRLFYVIYENPSLLKDPISIFKIWEGGFVFWGGFILAAGASAGFCVWKKCSFWSWADIFTPWISVGYIWGRIGCFLEGCCYGQYCDLPWAWEGRHPTQWYAALSELLLLLFIVSEKKRASSFYPTGSLFLIWLIGHSFARFVLVEPFRDDYRGPEIFNMSISSFLSLIFLLIGLGIFYYKIHNREPQNP
ncbi:MAG: prolipoprotein diacylglyceryl transferase [Bdellovibrionaceae bacterium]|nr:prolipoprotein diacylglyceryl transferase [Pseudobdellovibrionaceae bacterium]MDW8189560.1 prolipoprotein diacylglyceryl transferase [Pseudobdellovibrionaceae bacterium]